MIVGFFFFFLGKRTEMLFKKQYELNQNTKILGSEEESPQSMLHHEKRA